MELVAVFRCVLAVLVVTEVTCQTTKTTQSYCDICTSHTMCIYSDETFKCPGFLAEGVSSKDIDLILQTHNDYRSLVAAGSGTRGLNGNAQPPAANMRQMSWDPELAAIAQRWANRCTWDHDQCRNVDRFPCGQNAYYGRRSKNVPTPDWAAVINSWFAEIDLYDGSKAKAFEFDDATGHYTQMVWADTYFIGCGVTSFYEAPWYSKMYFCNYGPAGNWFGEPLYRQGLAASLCPTGTLANLTDGLCWMDDTSVSTTTTVNMTTTTLPSAMKGMTCTCTAAVATAPTSTLATAAKSSASTKKKKT